LDIRHDAKWPALSPAPVTTGTAFEQVVAEQADTLLGGCPAGDDGDQQGGDEQAGQQVDGGQDRGVAGESFEHRTQPGAVEALEELLAVPDGPVVLLATLRTDVEQALRGTAGWRLLDRAEHRIHLHRHPPHEDELRAELERLLHYRQFLVGRHDAIRPSMHDDPEYR
jgi:hypothetical protein